MANADGGIAPGSGETPDFGFKNIIGQSRPIRDAVALARRITAARRTTVLLIGETGTGKALFARCIHYESAAAHEPFVTINCAGSGTIFLDEIHHLPATLQPKLLRVLESRSVRRLGGFEEIAIECRVIAAAGQMLEQVVATGEFREDLCYRLNVFSMTIPPLRDRVEDIDLMALHFLAQETRQYQGPRRFSDEAVEALRIHRWPGNVRELKNVVERAAILSGDAPVIGTEHLMIQRRSASRPHSSADGGDIRIPREGKSLAEIEREAVCITLLMTGGNQAAAARLLRISRPTLAKKMNEGVRKPEPAIP